MSPYTHRPYSEIYLIETRGDAPLVRTRREFDGFPQGTLGAIKGVRGSYLVVQLAGAPGESMMIANELENV